MPKITNKMFVCAGKAYECTVWYTASDKFFIKGFPQDIQSAAKITPFGSKTEDELYNRYNEGIKHYEDIIAQSNKVIVFHINAAKEHLENRGIRAYKTETVGLHDDHHADMGFTINYEIKMLRVVGEDRFLHGFSDTGTLYNGEKIVNENYNQIIDYTPEREQMFKELFTRFDKLFEYFFAGIKEPEKFIDSINSIKLLK